MKKLQSQLEICKLHQAEYRWHNHMRQLDLTMREPNTTQIICTDFGATLDLGAVEKDNCSVDNHAIICIFLLYTTGGWLTSQMMETSTRLLLMIAISGYGLEIQ